MALTLPRPRYHLWSFVYQGDGDHMSHHNAFVFNDQNEALKSNFLGKRKRHLAPRDYSQSFFARSLRFSVLRVVIFGIF